MGDDVTRRTDAGNYEDMTLDFWRQYNNQIGWAACQPGWISDVWVNDGIDVNDVNDARRCGIASVLSQLCLLDSKLNGRNNLRGRGNAGITQLSNDAISLGYADIIKENCKQFVGLRMTAIPKSAAIAYFSAAIRESYQEMIVQLRGRGKGAKSEQGGFHPPEQSGSEIPEKDKIQGFSKYDIRDAKRNYNPDDGTIGPCGSNNYVCQAYDALWFFCKL